jgi:hypothetical protein
MSGEHVGDPPVDPADADPTSSTAEEESGLPLVHRREFLKAFTPGMIGMMVLDESIGLDG